MAAATLTGSTSGQRRKLSHAIDVLRMEAVHLAVVRFSAEQEIHDERT